MARPDPRALLAAVPAAKPAVTVVAAVGVATGVVALAQAVALAVTVTTAVTGGSLAMPLVTLVALLIVHGGLAAIGEYAARRAGHLAASGVRTRVLRRWLALPEGQRPSDDEATTLIGEGVCAIEPYVARYVPALITAAVVPALAVLTLAFVDVWSALIVVLTLPLLPLFAALIGMHTRDQTQRRWAAMTQLSGHFLDVVRGLPTLVAYGRAEQQVEVVREVGERHRCATVRTLRTAFMSTAALELLATISVAMVAVGVGLRLAYGTIDLQVGLMAILLAPEAYWPIRRVGSEFHNAADGVEAIDSLGEDLRADPPLGAGNAGSRRSNGTVGSADRHGSEASGGVVVVVANLRYAYPGRHEVLHELDLSVSASPGLTVLTGASGTGKTTLLEVLARLRLPQSGTVTCPSAHLATQRPLLLAGTVLDNLRITDPDVSEARAQWALGEVGLLGALSIRDGLHTEMGDDGFGLSAGQRTRLALARALLSPQPVVLLDEPTAHIAVESLPQIYAVIAAIARGRRVIAATHDHDLAANADSRWALPANPMPPTHQANSPRSAQSSPTMPMPTAEPSSRWQQLRPATRLRVACAMGGLSVASGVALTATSGWLIVQASFQPVVLTLLVAIVGVRTFGLARPVLRYGERVVSHDVALADLARRRADLYAGLIPLTPARLGRGSRNDFLTAVVRDLDDVVDEQVRVTVPWWSTVIASAVAVVVVGFALPWAGLAVLLGALAAGLVGHVVFRTERRAQGCAVQARGDVLRIATTLTHRITAIQAVAGAASERLVDGLDCAQDAAGHAEMRLIRARAVGIAAAWLVVAATSAAVVVLAASAFAVGDLGAPMAALVALTPMALADAWVTLPEVCGAQARARAAESRLAAVLQQTPAVTEPDGLPDLAVEVDVTPVHLDNLSASWTHNSSDASNSRSPLRSELTPDLDALDLGPLHTGDRVQLTGPNGIGKSTALAVLGRHLDPLSGIYRLAGQDATTVTAESVRSRIAIVDDEPHAFAGTVRANLALAAPEASDDAMVKALDAADLGRWLAGLPRGLDTPIAGVSGGERARLSMARAVLSDRPIVLLDEPTAHLDDTTAGRALDGLSGSGIPIVVAVSHRPLPWTGFEVFSLDHRETASP